MILLSKKMKIMICSILGLYFCYSSVLMNFRLDVRNTLDFVDKDNGGEIVVENLDEYK